jgi:phosphate transport system substrate-binding protein
MAFHNLLNSKKALRLASKNWISSSFVGTFLLVNLLGCQGDSNSIQKEPVNKDVQPLKSSPLQGETSLTGAGASFPSPLYQNWFISIAQAHPNLKINYQSIGSGAGVEQFKSKTVDFAASDVAMTDEELAAIESGALMLPLTAGAIVLAYNLPTISELKLSRLAYTEIFSGKITNWNDEKIRTSNPDVALPDLPITVVHRSDGSGTTAVFTKNMATISDDFAKQIGEGKTVDWPAEGNFIGAKGNEGITAQLQQLEGALGYVEFGYAVGSELPFATLENRDGQFVKVSEEIGRKMLETITLPDNLRKFIVDAAGESSYPFVTYTWILAYQNYENSEKAIAVEMMVEYGLNQGQKIAGSLGYISLPESVRERVAAVADKITPKYSIQLIPIQKV